MNILKCYTCGNIDKKREYFQITLCAKCLHKKPLLRWLLFRYIKKTQRGNKK